MAGSASSEAQGGKGYQGLKDAAQLSSQLWRSLHKRARLPAVHARAQVAMPPQAGWQSGTVSASQPRAPTHLPVVDKVLEGGRLQLEADAGRVEGHDAARHCAHQPPPRGKQVGRGAPRSRRGGPRRSVRARIPPAVWADGACRDLRMGMVLTRAGAAAGADPRAQAAPHALRSVRVGLPAGSCAAGKPPLPPRTSSSATARPWGPRPGAHRRTCPWPAGCSSPGPPAGCAA